MLRPRPLQERGMRQDIRRRPDLTEELLRRKQSASFGKVVKYRLVSPANRPQARARSFQQR
jgi:hypothetical protein